MQYTISKVILILLVCYACNDSNFKKNTIETKSLEQKKDTLYSDDVLREYKGEFKDYQSSLEFIYSDGKGNITNGLKSDVTNYLNVIYLSQKFPELNENYEIRLYPVTQNFEYKRVTRNKFELKINQKADIIVFNVYVSCKKFIFKYAKFDNDNNLTYVQTDEVGLSRFHEPVSEVRK